MACPGCGAEISATAKFCAECGLPQQAVCTTCSNPLAAGAKFCSECGTPAGAATATVSPSSAPYVPAGPVAERRVCSVLFCDLVGFTPLSESRDPEEVRELLSRYFELARTLIGRYGGGVAKILGGAGMGGGGGTPPHPGGAARAGGGGDATHR